MQYYDSDLNSEMDPQDFESDHEPPKEMKYDKKSLLKTKELKIYKKILEVGEGIQRPARYDLVKIRRKEIQTDDPDKVNTEEISQEEILEFNVGLHEIGEWMNTALENMRKKEMSIIIVKNIGLDESTQNKTQSFKYYVIQLIDWTTIVDLDQDFNYMKKILQKGTGNERYAEPDEVTFSFKLSQGDKVLLDKEIESKIELGGEGIPSNVMKILRTMKKTEICQVTVKIKKFLETETTVDLPNINIDIDTILIDVDCKDIVKITDIFENRQILKKTVRRGVHTAKPEPSSEIFFNYEIYDLSNNHKIYSSSDMEIELEDETWKDLDKLRDSNLCYRCYLDEYKISKVLKNCLKVTKKMEIAEARVFDVAKYVTYGDDYHQIIKYNPNLEQLKLKYIIKLYNFTEGKNAFTMTIDEKIFHGSRKKEIAVAQLKAGNYKKALKIFEHINSYFDIGKFLEEDQMKVQAIQVSSLLNTTLCLQKFENWKKLVIVADKVLNVEPNNIKAIYRKALALKNLQEFESAIEILEKALKNIENDTLLKQKTDATMIKDLDSLLKTAKIAQNNYLKKQKNVYKSMFAASEE